MAARKHPARSGHADRSTSPKFDAELASADEILQHAIEKLKLGFKELREKEERVSN
jgi:hypothetical protein